MLKFTVESSLADLRSLLDNRMESTVRSLESAVLVSCEPFVPYYTGRLCSSGHASGVGINGEVTYSADYAAECYYASREFNKKKHPRASAYWFEAAKAEDLSKWISTAADGLCSGRSAAGSSDSNLRFGIAKAAAY